MYSVHCPYAVFFVDQNGDTDLGSRDHVDVDPFIIKAFKHLSCNTRITHHSGADNGKFRNISFGMQFLLAKTRLMFFQCCHRIIQIFAVNGKRNILRTGTSDRLQDHIYVDMFFGKYIK